MTCVASPNVNMAIPASVNMNDSDDRAQLWELKKKYLKARNDSWNSMSSPP
jgi:hypothetical protein